MHLFPLRRSLAFLPLLTAQPLSGGIAPQRHLTPLRVHDAVSSAPLGFFLASLPHHSSSTTPPIKYSDIVVSPQHTVILGAAVCRCLSFFFFFFIYAMARVFVYSLVVRGWFCGLLVYIIYFLLGLKIMGIDSGCGLWQWNRGAFGTLYCIMLYCIILMLMYCIMPHCINTLL